MTTDVKSVSITTIIYINTKTGESTKVEVIY